jgi:hypothetical protein
MLIENSPAASVSLDKEQSLPVLLPGVLGINTMPQKRPTQPWSSPDEGAFGGPGVFLRLEASIGQGFL